MKTRALFASLFLVLSCNEASSDSDTAGSRGGQENFGGDGSGDGSGGDSSGGDGLGGEGGEPGNQGSGGWAPLEPDLAVDLEWEQLPLLAGDPMESGSEAQLMLGPEDDIFVGFVQSGELFTGPGSVMIYRYDEAGGWETVGGEPIVTGESVILTGFGVAADGVVFAASGSTYRMLVGDVWEEWTPPASPVNRGFVRTPSHQLFLMGETAGGALQVYEYSEGSFLPYGPELDASVRLFSPTAVIAVSPSGDVAFADNDRIVHLLSGGAWSELGAYFHENAVLPAFPDLEFDPEGTLHVAYNFDLEEGGFAVAVAEYEAGDFTLLPGAPTYGGSPRYITVAFRADGELLATWREDVLHVSSHQGGDWMPFISEGQVAESTDGRGTLPSIALTARGRPVVTWEQVTDAAGSAVGVARAVAR